MPYLLFPLFSFPSNSLFVFCLPSEAIILMEKNFLLFDLSWKISLRFPREVDMDERGVES